MARALLALILALCSPQATNAASCDARQRGAKGDGKADDAKHIQALLEDESCSEVLLRGGTFLSSALEVRRSDVTLTIESGAKLAGKPGSGIKQCSSEADWKGAPTPTPDPQSAAAAGSSPAVGLRRLVLLLHG